MFGSTNHNIFVLQSNIIESHIFCLVCNLYTNSSFLISKQTCESALFEFQSFNVIGNVLVTSVNPTHLIFVPSYNEK